METKNIHEQIADCAESYKEAKDLFDKEYKYPFYRIIFKTIRDRLVELDGRDPNEIEPTSSIYDEYENGSPTQNCEFECALPFHLPYDNKANDDGAVRRERFYNFLSSGVECGCCCLFLERIGSEKENEAIHTIQVRDEDYYWLYKRLLRMGFFDDDMKKDFELHNE